MIRARTGTTSSADNRKKAAADFAGGETKIFISVLMLGAMVLSVFFFSGQSLRLDEAQSLWQTSNSISGMFHIVAQDVHVPFYHVILHYWQSLFGNSVVLARMLSLVFFLLLIPVMYIVGRRIYSSAVGLFAALLVSISPFLNWYGNEIRMYSLFALLTLLNQYFFMRIFMDREDLSGDVSGKVWLGYIVTVMIGMFTHYFFVFNVISQAVFFFAYRRRFPRQALRMFILTGVMGLILFAPWLYYVYNLGSAANTQPALAAPSTIDLFNTFSQFIFGFQNDRVNTIIISLWPLLVLLLFLAVRRNQKINPQTFYLLICAFLPIAMAFALSTELKPIYLTRYLILALPAFYLLISWALSLYPVRLSQVLKVLTVFSMAATLCVEIVNANTPVKEDYRSASDYLSLYATPKDIIVLSAPFTVYPFEYYYRGSTAVQTLPIWNQYAVGAIPAYSSSVLARDADTIKDSHQTLWLLLSYDQGYEKEVKLYFDTHYERTSVINFSPGLNLYAYRLRYDDTSFSTAMKRIQEGRVTASASGGSTTPAKGISSRHSSVALGGR